MNRLFNILVILSCTVIASCSCGKVNSSETPEAPYVRVGSGEKLVSNKSGTFEVYVTSNTSWTVTAQADWLSVNVTEGSGNKNIIIRYEGNYEADGVTPCPERTGTVRIAAEGTIPARITVKQGARTFKNPVFQPMPDPYVWREDHGQSVYYYPCKSVGSGINLGKTNKLTVFGGTKTVWKCPADGAVKVWNRANLWAPELFRIDGVWYIYYAAGRPSNELGSDGKEVGYSTQRTGVLRCTAEDPTTGTWEDMGMLFTGDEKDFESYRNGDKLTTENTIYAIDMTVFKLGDQLYAIWSGNISKTDGNQRLYIATMENPWTINCPRVEISRPDYIWEKISRSINEGPSMLFNPDKTKLYCVYSANASWTKDYRLGWLELDLTDPQRNDPMVKSNWKKCPDYAFWRCDNVSKASNPNADNPQNASTMHIGGVHGVGHNTFTKSPDGTEDWIVYHVKRYKDDGWDNRDCFIQKINWKKDGTPDFGTPAGWQQELEVPSGEPLE